MQCRMQAILQRPSLSDPPAKLGDFMPLVTSSMTPQGVHLQSSHDQHLLAGFAFIVPSAIALVSSVACAVRQCMTMCD